MALLGGAMFRDLAITATAFGIDIEQLKRAGPAAVLALFLGLSVSFAVGATVGYLSGFRDPISLTTIGAGAATYIVGPVTGSSLDASSEVMALSITTGLVKAILTTAVTPVVARTIGLDHPRAAMIFGGLLGTTSGVAAGLAATNPKLVPYGAMTATF